MAVWFCACARTRVCVEELIGHVQTCKIYLHSTWTLIVQTRRPIPPSLPHGCSQAHKVPTSHRLQGVWESRNASKSNENVTILLTRKPRSSWAISKRQDCLQTPMHQYECILNCLHNIIPTVWKVTRTQIQCFVVQNFLIRFRTSYLLFFTFIMVCMLF